MAKKVVDSFDELSNGYARVGAHRGPAPRSRIWIQLGIMVAAFAVLVGVGQFAIYQLGLSVPGSSSEAAPKYPEVEKPEYSPAVVPAAKDPDMEITVLNGTEVSGFASQIGDYLTDRDFHVIARANASTHDIEESVVFYNHLDVEAAARALAEEIGVTRVELSTSYQGSHITLLLGTDFRIPTA